MKRLAIFTVAVLLMAGAAWAGPLVSKDIGSDAKWFGHVNFEAIRSMKLVQDLKDKCPAYQRCQAKMQEMAKKLGMNPMEDLLAVTLYANQYGEQAGVGLFYVKTLDRQKLLGLLKEKHPDHKTSQYGSRTLYSCIVAHHGKKMELTGTFASDKLVVLGANVEQVKAALDVLDGKKPALAKDAPLIKGVAKNALFASRGVDVPEDYRKTTKCPVLQHCKAASVQWTDKGGEIAGKYEFTTISEQTAKNFKAIVDGLKAMGDLRYNDIPTVKKVMDGLKYSAKGELFAVTFKTTTGDLEAAVKAVMERKKACPTCTKEHGEKEKCPAAKK